MLTAQASGGVYEERYVLMEELQTLLHQTIHHQEVGRHKDGDWVLLSLQGGGLQGFGEDLPTGATEHAPFGILHEPAKDLDVAMDTYVQDVNQLEPWGVIVHQESHFSHDDITRTAKVLLCYSNVKDDLTQWPCY